ncbi:MAG: hypothetical protein WAQ29_09825 [Nitrososphaeraceae archaeon]
MTNSSKKDNDLSNIWTKRFIAAAIIQGAIIVVLTAFLIVSQMSFLKPEISRVIASGGAGTWFTFGYFMYIVVGVIGIAVSAIFYHYTEEVLNKQLYYRKSKIAKGLAWSHFLLMNIGIVASAGMLMYAGYAAGAAMLPESVGGKGFDAGQVHEILAPFVEPIAAAVLVLLIGVTLGGIGFLFVNYHRLKSPT